jgi:hypothetical protein
MGRLRSGIVTQIQSALENSCFTAWDFTFEHPEEGRDMLRIKFTSNPQYMFVIQDNAQAQTMYRSVQIPGAAMMEEISGFSDISACINKIPTWCKAIREEIIENVPKPIIDEIESFRKEILEQLNNKTEEMNGLYNKNEINDLHEKLERFKDQCDLLQAKQVITESELSKTKNDIDSIKENAKTFPKNVWLRTTTNKLFSLFIRTAGSKEARELVVHAVKAVLPGDGQPPQAP